MGLHIADPDFTAKLAQAPLDAELIDQIANVRHEAWMKEKEKQGYRYAPPPRSDIKPNLTHPLMLPYSELSELEKEGDRRPARLTADYLKRLGYNIRRRPASGSSPGAISTFPTDDLNKLIHHEHNIWMQEKWLTGWDSADIAQNHLRLHHDLVDTAALSSTERALDQAIINALPNGLQAAGWEITK